MATSTCPDPLTTLTELLHSDGWEVQLAGTPTTSTAPSSARGVAYVVPAPTHPSPGEPR